MIGRFEKFDMLVMGVIAALIVSIIAVITFGNKSGTPLQGILYIRIEAGPASAIQNLWVVDPQKTSDNQQITKSQYGVLDFDVSPDGQRVVYSEMQEDQTSALKLLDLSTRQSQLLYDCKEASCTEPVWQPNGSLIAFSRSAIVSGLASSYGALRTWLFDMKTNQAIPLYQDGQRLGYSPRWSPDGSKLAMFDSGSEGIVIHDFNTGKDILLPNDNGLIGTFSPDERWFWYPTVTKLSEEQYVTRIVLADLSTDPVRTRDLAANPAEGDDMEAVWMSNSQTLIVARRPPMASGGQEAQLYTIDVATGKAAPFLLDAKYTHMSLIANPSGSKLLLERFSRQETDARIQLWVMDLKTKELLRVSSNVSFPKWIP